MSITPAPGSAVPRGVGEVGILLARRPEAADGDDLSDLALAGSPRGRARSRVVASVMADEQPTVAARDGLDEPKRLRVVDGDRLLEQHGDAGLEAFDRGLDVERIGVRDDRPHRARSASSIAAAPSVRRAAEPAVDGGGIGDRRRAPPARGADELDVLAPHEAAADDADANGRGLGCGHGASLRRCDGDSPDRAYGTMERRAGHVPFSGERPRPAATNACSTRRDIALRTERSR